MPGHTLFPTAIGTCGIAWGEHGIVGCQLPEASPEATQARLLKRCPDAAEAEPPPEVQAAIDGVVALLAGGNPDLSGIPLELEGVPAFHAAVYAVARTIPPGATLTYGEVARRLGDPRVARAVGQALGRNPFAPIVPCHRVLAAGGKTGGFSAHGSVATKLKLLAIEGVQIGADARDQLELF
jgi:methylated-DNA-[protein]-cysteine S-methyltransferase